MPVRDISPTDFDRAAGRPHPCRHCGGAWSLHSAREFCPGERAYEWLTTRYESNPAAARAEERRVAGVEGLVRHRKKLRAIAAIVAEHSGWSIEALRGPRKSRTLTHVRQVAIWLCRRHTVCSYPEIAAFFGDRDHSTIVHAERRITRLMREDEEVFAEVTSLQERIDRRPAEVRAHG